MHDVNFPLKKTYRKKTSILVFCLAYGLWLFPVITPLSSFPQETKYKIRKQLTPETTKLPIISEDIDPSLSPSADSLFTGIPIQPRGFRYKNAPLILSGGVQPLIGGSIIQTLPSTSCENSDFALGTFLHWSGCSGLWCSGTANNTRCWLTSIPSFYPPCENLFQPWYNTPVGGHFSIEDPGNDPCITGLIRVFPGDAHSALIGNRLCSGNGGGYVDQLTFPITYDPNNSFFIYRCAVVLQNISDPTHNTADKRPRFTLTIIDHITQVIIDSTCGFYDLYPGDGITNWNTQGSWVWKDWSTIGIDLSVLPGLTTGQLLDVVINVHGCGFTAHTGYAYISAFCGSMDIQLMGCEGSGQVVLEGPPGFTTYEWQGPYCPLCPDPPPIYTGNPITITTAQGAVTGNVFHLTLTALNGCQVTNVLQTIAFTFTTAGYTQTLNCAQRPSSFFDTTWVSQNQVTAWRWFFGDPASGAADSSHLKNPTHSFTAPGTYTVTLISYSTEGCSDTVSKQLTIGPLPDVSNASRYKIICSHDSTNITLTSNIAGTFFTWTATPTSPLITGYSNQALPASYINDHLVNNGNQIDSVIYHVVPQNVSCTGDTVNFYVAVYPHPNLTNASLIKSICDSTWTNVQLQSNVGTTMFTWTCTASSANVTGYSDNLNNPVTIINQLLRNTGFTTDTVYYHLMPHANGCLGDTTVYKVAVHPMTVPAISGPAGVCLNSTTTYTTTAGMTGYTWTVSAGGTITSGAGTNTVNINWSSNGLKTITLNYTDGNGCMAATPSTYNVNVSTLPVPGLNGAVSMCVGFSTTYTTDLGMINYLWSVSAGGTITAGGGPADHTVTVLWNTTGAQSVSINYESGPGCTAASPTVLNVTVHSLPVVTIAGTGTLCAGATGVIYSTQPGMSNYLWTVSAGGTITAGGGTTNNTVTVTWNTPGAQSVSVNYSDANGCTAISPAVWPVTVNALPVPALSGPAAICLNTSGTYITDAGMSGYIWSVSAGGTITAGTGTNSITVLWSTLGAKTITVNYTNANGCTAASATTYNVTVNTLPVPSLTGNNSLCSQSSATYTTDLGMSNYVWSVSAGGTITAGGGTGNNTATVLWNTAGAQTVSINYTVGTGCTAPTPTVLNVTVKPRPAVTNNQTAFTQCSAATTNILLTASLPGTTFSWTATGSSGNVTGFIAGSGSLIAQTLMNNGFILETVTYAITPSLNGCDGTAINFVVTVNPVTDVYFTPNGQTFCSGNTTNIILQSNVALTTFTYTATGTSGNVSGFGPGNTSPISQTLINSGAVPESVTYTVTPTFSGCTGTPSNVIVNVNPKSSVSYTLCSDPITITTAQPFRLRGGIPLGGTYSGTGTNAGFFFPSLAGSGNHTITYSYLNTWGCSDAASQVISVINPVGFTCDNALTDIRDNKQYPTIKIGTQCWMAANLNYGNMIASTQMQRDNCQLEKYCFNDNIANCTSDGGMYQWDEMMKYNSGAAEQGFCPPGWHVPTENEWGTLFNYYISNGFAGSPLKYTGYSNFNAFLSGTRFMNVEWDFSNFAVMFWSSTAHGPTKAWAHGMNTFNPSVSYYPSSRTNAFYLRCIKD